MYSEEIENNSIQLLSKDQNVSTTSEATAISKSISGPRTTDKKLVPSDNSQQLAEKEIAMKRDLIITRNKLICKLLKRFSYQTRKNKKEAEQTAKRLSLLINGVLNEDPNNISAIHYAIEFSKIRCDIPETIRLLQRKLEITPDDSVAQKELETLQKKPKPQKKFQPDKHLFLSQYKHLKETGDLDGLETLLRTRLFTFPGDILLENQLAGVLLDKIALNPDESLELIEEVRQILYGLREVVPNNLRITSNLIRLEKLAANEQAFENHTRYLIAQAPSNYKAKTQLAQILITRCKSQGIANAKEHGLIEETNSLLNQLSNEFPNNPIVINIALHFARFLGDLEREETLLRQAIQLDPTNLILKSKLTAVLVAICSKRSSVNENDPRLLEAEQLALEDFEENPQNLYTITYLARIARLKGTIYKEKKWLELKLSMDPNNIKAKERLERINKKLIAKPTPPLPSESPKKAPKVAPKSTPKETPKGAQKNTPPNTPKNSTTFTPSPSLMLYKTTLMNSIKNGDNQSTLNILNEMLQNPSIDDASKKKIRVMVDLARSNKPRSQLTLRTKIQDFK